MRYKTGTEFRVPLSPRAVELLTQARGSTDDDGLVFPSPVTGRAVSENTYVKLLRDLDIPTSAHGLRATFRSWCSDTGVPRDPSPRWHWATPFAAWRAHTPALTCSNAAVPSCSNGPPNIT